MFRIGYFADGSWAHEAFKKLIADNTIKICFICVRNDHKDPVLVEEGQKNNIEVFWTKNINSEEFINLIKTYNLDLIVSMSFNQIFKKAIINVPRLKTINCHAGKLPFYRGRNILNWVLINDEKEFGITVHYVDEGIDTGDIILQEVYSITDEDNYGTLLERSYTGCADILYRAIKLVQSGNVKPRKQSDIDPVGSYCGIRSQGDELLDWNQTSREIFNFVRAISKPGPMAQTFIDGISVSINKVALIEGAHIYKGIPGQIIGKSENGWIVKTNDTMIIVQEYSTEAKLRVGKRFENA